MKQNVFLLSVQIQSFYHNPAGIYMFKVNNGNTRKRCEIRSKLVAKTPERHWLFADLQMAERAFLPIGLQRIQKL